MKIGRWPDAYDHGTYDRTESLNPEKGFGLGDRELYIEKGKIHVLFILRTVSTFLLKNSCAYYWIKKIKFI